MSPPPIILSLVPVDDPVHAQSIAFLPSDSQDLLLGGTHLSRYTDIRPTYHAIDFTFSQQQLPPDHARVSLTDGKVFITALREDDTVCVNGVPLPSAASMPLRHRDRLELSYYEPYDDLVNPVIAFDIHITSTPLPSPSTSRHYSQPPLPHIASTPSVLHAFDQLHRLTQRLSAELASTQERLQASLDAAAAHICVALPSPRSYGNLLADLRARAEDPNSSSRPSTPLASAALDFPPMSCSSPFIHGSPPSSTRSSSIPASSSAATSVLTSVLRLEAPPSHTATLSTESISPFTPSSTSESACSSLPTATTLSFTSTSTSTLTSVRGPVPPSISLSASASSNIPSDKPSSLSTSSSTSVPRSNTPNKLFSSPSTSSSSACHASSELGACSLTPSPTVTTSQLSPPPLLSSSSARVHSSSNLANFEAALGRVRSAWISARQRLEAITAPGRRTSLFPSTTEPRAVGAIELALSRVRMAWMRTRADLLTGM
ncbi:hypothetical protein CF326_g8857 [Tilletia indica]|nr:hypothetical protein CF326_g8857 [Tilletia indica]